MPGTTYEAKSNDTMLDFVRAAYPKVIKKGFDITCRDYRNYVVADWFASKRDKTKTGSYCTWPLMTTKGTSAKQDAWNAKDSVSQQDVMAQGHAQWTHATWNVAWFRQELLMVQNDPEALYDLMSARRASEQVGALENILEPGLWSAPTNPTDAQNTPMGIPFWVQKNAAASADGEFNGGDPSGFTAGAGGIAVADVPGYDNWVGVYTNADDADLVKKMRRMEYRIKFIKPKIIGNDIPVENMNQHFYLNLETLLNLQDVAKQNNDQLGFNLAVGGQVMFDGRQLEEVDYLRNDTQNPIYGLDLNTIYPVCLKGDRFVESEPKVVGDQHNVYAVFTDVTYQYVCDNRKRNGVIHTA